MNNVQPRIMQFPSVIIHRPLSAGTAALSLLVIAFALYQRLLGNTYLEQLEWIDAFTPVMIAILLLRGVWTLRRDTDLQAVSIALIGALSFIFTYEAVYKILFYLPPKQIAPAELREFLIQAATGTTALAGFAFGKFRLTKPGLVFLGLFAALYLFWLLAGYPQVDNPANYYTARIPVPFTWDSIYLLNRATKVMLFLAYFFFYTGGPVKRED